jgi:CubicO group peptidase (beta-lactamase class C family)
LASLLARRSAAISNFGVTLCLATSFAIQAQGQVKAQAPQDIPQQFEGVDSFIRNEMAKQHIPGISGKVVYEKGYGVADSADGTAVPPKTPFYTASVTKAFTGTSLILLEAEHKLDLDRPANDYLRSAKLQSRCGMCPPLQSGVSRTTPEV